MLCSTRNDEGPAKALSRALFEAFTSRITTDTKKWETIFKETIDSDIPTLIARSNNVSIRLDLRGTHTQISLRNHRPTKERTEAIGRARVKPIGIAVGISTCHEASKEVRSTPVLKRDFSEMTLFGQKTKIPIDQITVNARDPAVYYPGATDIEAICEDIDEPVNTLYIGVKDSADNSAARDAYRVLLSKYKKVDGGPIPNNGKGYARFAAAGIAIELHAWGRGQDFLLTYMIEKEFELLRKAREKRRQAL